jgi:SAM-dependent methyltransferase
VTGPKSWRGGAVGASPSTDMCWSASSWDVGCGAGRFSRIAADRGAMISGLDATASFVEIARERVPEGDFRVGEMEDLPWADNSFDVVTGFNSFFIAADMVNALREARRVMRPGASVVMTVFGRPERCQSTTLFASLRQFMPTSANSAANEEEGLDISWEASTYAAAGLVPPRLDQGLPGPHHRRLGPLTPRGLKPERIASMLTSTVVAVACTLKAGEALTTMHPGHRPVELSPCDLHPGLGQPPSPRHQPNPRTRLPPLRVTRIAPLPRLGAGFAAAHVALGVPSGVRSPW